MTHTSGPWTKKEYAGWTSSDGMVDHGGYQIDAPNITQLAYVWRCNKRWGDNPEPFGAAEAEANANLIIAAPDMLGALKYARRFLNKKDHDTDFVDAAIAKATATEGGSHV